MTWEGDVEGFIFALFDIEKLIKSGGGNKASPPGRHQEQAPKQRCTFSPTTFSSVQFSSGGGVGAKDLSLWARYGFFSNH